MESGELTLYDAQDDDVWYFRRIPTNWTNYHRKSHPSISHYRQRTASYDATGIITAAGAAYRAGKTTVVIGVIAKYLFYLGDSIDLSVAGHIFYGLECGENKK
jgi:hypothetical protein